MTDETDMANLTLREQANFLSWCNLMVGILILSLVVQDWKSDSLLMRISGIVMGAYCAVSGFLFLTGGIA